MRSPRVEFALSLGFTYEDGQTFIFDNLATPFGIGRTSIIKFGQDYIKREPQGAWFLRRRSPPQASQFSFGIDILDATINNHPIPDGRFFS